MNRYYLSYRLRLNEPLILSNGSQMGNVLATQDHIPGTTILGLCAGLYLRQNRSAGLSPEHAHACPEFRDLFLSDRTIFSNAYPVADGTEKSIPMPCSVFGCKSYGFRIPKPAGRTMHGMFDCLYRDIPEVCPEPSCDEPVEHKAGYGYFHAKAGYCSHDVSRRIISHNQVAESSGDKGLFSFEALSEGQAFYGEISFSDEARRETLFKLLAENPAAKLGKARRRGYGGVAFLRPVRQEESLRRRIGNTSTAPGEKENFSIYLFSDAVVLDRALNYRSTLDEYTLASTLNVAPHELEVCPREGQEGGRSFWKNGVLMGFNEKRRMPLPMEQTILRGSVFTVRYSGKEDISAGLTSLVENGIGIRRNEGFGQVVIDLKVHHQHENKEEEKDA